jgi:cytochrome b561
MPSRECQRHLHETLGLGVLLLVPIRLFWRRVETRPAPRQVPPWMDITARMTQVALYLLLVAVPCTAVAGASSRVAG